MPPRVLVTRASEDARVFSHFLSNAGFESVVVPTIERRWCVHALAESLRGAVLPDWILLTSTTAVEVLAAACPTIPERTKLAAVGSSTARRAREIGLPIDRVPEVFTRKALIEALGNVRGMQVCYPRSEIAPTVLKDALTDAGAIVTDVVAYTNAAPAGYEHDLLSALPVDVTTLFSGSAARRVAAAVPENARDQLGVIAAIGPSTAKNASDAGLHVGAVATPHTVAGMVDLTRKIISQTHGDLEH